jgi:hypothetical protein
VENLSGRCSELLFHNQKVFNIKMYHKSWFRHQLTTWAENKKFFSTLCMADDSNGVNVNVNTFKVPLISACCESMWQSAGGEKLFSNILLLTPLRLDSCFLSCYAGSNIFHPFRYLISKIIKKNNNSEVCVFLSVAGRHFRRCLW